MSKKFTHKGYTLTQADYNYHYMIFDKSGDMVMHCPYSKPITEDKAKELIEHYISFTNIPENVLDKLLEDEEETEV